MAQKYLKRMTQCATCAYWTGDRETDIFFQKVIVESAASIGKCKNRRSGWNNQNKLANASCDKYEKWGVLK